VHWRHPLQYFGQWEYPHQFAPPRLLPGAEGMFPGEKEHPLPTLHPLGASPNFELALTPMTEWSAATVSQSQRVCIYW